MRRACIHGLSIGLMVIGACSTTAGTSPHDMSAAGHQQAGTAEQEEATRHMSSYEAARLAEVEQCRGGGWVCWTSTTNPTEGHRALAERHARAARQHRSAAQALAEAEASWCDGVPDLDRDMSPFAHREDISSVAPLFRVSRSSSKAAEKRTLVGARIAFMPVRGLTRERLQAVLNCHLARNAVMGHDVPEMDYCPLVPKDVNVQVGSRGDQFTADVESRNPTSAAEILERASRLGVPRAAPADRR